VIPVLVLEGLPQLYIASYSEKCATKLDGVQFALHFNGLYVKGAGKLGHYRERALSAVP
jgi:hypothetical protein